MEASASIVLSVGMCLTIRLNCFVRWYVFDFTVRHTPHFVFVHRFAIGTATGSSFSPLREGMGCRIALIINRSLPRHPLSERGARSAGCVALSN